MTATTWDPANKASTISLSNGNLSAAGSAATWGTVLATLSHNTGKWYGENTLNLVSGSQFSGFGDSTITLADSLGGSGNSAGVRSTGATGVFGSFTLVNAVGVTWGGGDRLDWAIDLDAGKAWIGKNGTWCASGNPAAGTNPWVTFTASTTIFPAWASTNSSDTVTTDFGGSGFTDTMPAGFSRWQGTVAYPLTAAAGSYSLSGIAAHLTKAWSPLAAATGTYVLTGHSVTKAIKMAASAGAYALTGVAAAIKKALHLTAVTGSYVLTGFGIKKAIVMIAATGTYALTGTALLEAFLSAAADKFLLRQARFVLQKLRATDPTLEQ